MNPSRLLANTIFDPPACGIGAADTSNMKRRADESESGNQERSGDVVTNGKKPNGSRLNRIDARSIVGRLRTILTRSSDLAVGVTVGVGKAVGVASGVGRTRGGKGSPTRRPFRDSSGLRRERIVEGSAAAARGA